LNDCCLRVEVFSYHAGEITPTHLGKEVVV
jgi:hypothetical protein